MSNLTLLERFAALIKIIFTTPFFITLFGFMVFTIIIFSVYGATNSKLSKILLTISYILMTSFLLIEYGTVMIGLFDTFVDQVFIAIYFPNLITYICMVAVEILFVIASIFNKRIKGFVRICNILSFIVIMFLFILTIDVISKNNMSLFDSAVLYSNKTLMILMQSSMAVFTCFIGLLVVNLVIKLINIKPNNNLEIFSENKESIEYMKSENVKYMTEEDYYQGYKFYNNKKQYQEYINSNEN